MVDLDTEFDDEGCVSAVSVECQIRFDDTQDLGANPTDDSDDIRKYMGTGSSPEIKVYRIRTSVLSNHVTIIGDPNKKFTYTLPE